VPRFVGDAAWDEDSYKSERVQQIGVFVPGKRASHSLPTPGGRDADTAPSHARRSQA